MGKAVPKWCVDAGDNEDIVETIRDYVKTHFPLSITNCDINARVCYAMLVGGMTNGVVSRSSCADNYNPHRRCLSLEQVCKWISRLCKSFREGDIQKDELLLIRFVAGDADSRDSDGHSIVIQMTRNGTLTLFQAYYDYTRIVAHREQDAVERLETMVHHMMHTPSSKVNATTFGLEKEDFGLDSASIAKALSSDAFAHPFEPHHASSAASFALLSDAFNTVMPSLSTDSYLSGIANATLHNEHVPIGPHGYTNAVGASLHDEHVPVELPRYTDAVGAPFHEHVPVEPPHNTDTVGASLHEHASSNVSDTGWAINPCQCYVYFH